MLAMRRCGHQSVCKNNTSLLSVMMTFFRGSEEPGDKVQSWYPDPNEKAKETRVMAPGWGGSVSVITVYDKHALVDVSSACCGKSSRGRIEG